jgi:hypothetical protein
VLKTDVSLVDAFLNLINYFFIWKAIMMLLHLIPPLACLVHATGNPKQEIPSLVFTIRNSQTAPPEKNVGLSGTSTGADILRVL